MKVTPPVAGSFRQQPPADLPQDLLETMAYFSRRRTEWKLVVVPEDPDQMTVANRIMARGAAAKECLTSPTFNDAYRLILSEKMDALLAVPAGDFDAKKRLSFEIEGLQAIIRSMGKFVGQGEQLLESFRNSGLNRAPEE